MPDPILQPSLAGGELSPALYARVDLGRYLTSVKTARNFITMIYGGAKNRPGTRFIQQAKVLGKRVRLIPFVFSKDQAYVLELGDRYLRAYYGGAPLAGVTNKPTYGSLTVASLGGGSFSLTGDQDSFVAGDVGRTVRIYLSQGDDYVITAVTDSKHATATSTANLTGLTVLTTTKWLFVNNPPGTVVFETDTPWSEADLRDLVYTQSADTITVCHPSYPPQDIRRLDDGTFQVVETLIINGPFQDTNFDKSITVSPSDVSGTVTLTASKPIFRSFHKGMLLYLESISPEKLWAPGQSVGLGDIRQSDGKYYKAITAGTTGGTAPSHYDGVQSDGAVNWLYVHSGFGIVKITDIGTLTNGFSTTATALVYGTLPSGTVIAVNTVNVASYSVSPANSAWIRATTSTAHGFADNAFVQYTAT